MKKLFTSFLLVAIIVAHAQNSFNSTANTRYSATASPANTYTSTATGVTVADKLTIYIKFLTANTGPSTLNINSTGAKPILKQGVALASDDIKVDQISILHYDGTSYNMIGDGGGAGGGGGGSGTVTNVATSNGITGGPITTTGTISGVNAQANASTKGVSSFTAGDFNDNGSGNISLDYANGQAATGSVNGFISSTDWTTFNGKLSSIADNSITNAKLADVATATFKGRTTAGTGDPEDLTVSQAKTLLDLTGTNSGDQTTIVGITGTLAQFNTAVTDADLARTDAANTFTGVQTFSTPIATGSVATMSATVGGGVPTPPNNTTTFLRGDGTFTAPSVAWSGLTGTPTAWMLAGTSTTTGAVTITNSLGTGINWNGTATNTASEDYAYKFEKTITGRGATNPDVYYGTYDNYSFTAGDHGQIFNGLFVNTVTNLNAKTSIVSNLADFRQSGTSRWKLINDGGVIHNMGTLSGFGYQFLGSSSAGSNGINGSYTETADGAYRANGTGRFGVMVTPLVAGANGILVTNNTLIPFDGNLAGIIYTNNSSAMTSNATKPLLTIKKMLGSPSGFDHTGSLLELYSNSATTGDFVNVANNGGVLTRITSTGDFILGPSVTGTPKLGVRGLGTTTGVLTLLENSSATEKFKVLDNGALSFGAGSGTSGYVLQSNGTSASPTWVALAAGGDMVLASTQTNSGAKTFLDGTMLLRNVANTFNGQFTNTNTANRTYTLKDANGTIAFMSDITGTNSGTNTGDQTDEFAQDAIGAMVDASLTYVDGTPLLQRAALTGDVTASAGSNTTTIANDVVTYAKIQNVGANEVLGRAASSSGDVSGIALSASQLFGRGSTGDLAPITLGTNVSMSGTTLNASGGGASDLSYAHAWANSPVSLNSSSGNDVTVTAGTGISLTGTSGNLTINAIGTSDAITWTSRVEAEANIWYSVTYGNGLFVAVTYNGTNRVMTSPDGVTWTARSAPGDHGWKGVTYGNGLFVAVAYDKVMTSPDGITWTLRTASEANEWWGITYGNGLFVAGANSGTNRIMTSPDGITWTNRTVESNSWTSITYGNGLFVAVSFNGTNRVTTSPDGITWTARSASQANQWYSVTYGNGLFVAVSIDGTDQVMTSNDGITWTPRVEAESPNDWYSVTYGNGLFVAVSVDGTNRVMTSPNGITWTARSASEVSNWYSITYGNGLFVAVANSGTNQVMTSGSSTGGAGSHTIKEEGTPLTTRTGLNFVGAAITATDDAGNDETDITIDSDINTIAGLTATTDNFLVANASAWASRTPAQAKTSLALDNVTNESKSTMFTSPTFTGTPVLGAATGTSLVLSSFLNEAKGADIASATTTDIGAATGTYIDVTGTTTITGFGTVQAGTRRIVTFTGALTLTHNATSLILPGAVNRTTVAGDCATFVSLGSGNWKCIMYQPTVVTGTGGRVLQTSPTLITPVLGVATATSINGNTFTTGTYTITGVAGKTLTFNNNLTLSGTDGSTLNVGAGGTLASIATSGSATDLSAGSVPAGRFGNTTIPIAAVNATGTPSIANYLRGDGTWSAPVGAGTVTNTGGNLTANAVVLGAGTADTKVVAGITTDGTSQLNLGVNTTTLGKLKMFGNTSGDATIQPSAVAGTSTVITLPARTGFIETIIGAPVILGSDYTNSTVTASEVTGLQVTATGTGLFQAEFNLFVQSAATTTGWKLGVNHTGTATVLGINMTYPSTGGTAATGIGEDVVANNTGSIYEASAATSFSTAANLGPTAGVAATGTNVWVKVTAVINVTATGDLELYGGSEIAASQITIKANSFVRLYPLN